MICFLLGGGCNKNLYFFEVVSRGSWKYLCVIFLLGLNKWKMIKFK